MTLSMNVLRVSLLKEWQKIERKKHLIAAFYFLSHAYFSCWHIAVLATPFIPASDGHSNFEFRLLLFKANYLLVLRYKNEMSK